VKVGSWIEDVDDREYPMLNVRRLGGRRDKSHPDKLAHPIIELTAYSDEGLLEAENLYEEALEELYEAVRLQKQTPAGYLVSINENMGAYQFSSLFQDSWRIQGLIQLGIRPPR